MRSLLHFLALSQQRLCRLLDRFLPKEYLVDGNTDFLSVFVPRYISPGQWVIDIGGGRNPAISSSDKSRNRLFVEGFDIDPGELSKAPTGSYDRKTVADILEVPPEPRADLAICQSLLEHVRDTDRAFEAISGLMKPGGILLLFVPSGKAVYARVARVIPDSLKQTLLGFIYHQSIDRRGFPSIYDRCSPGEFRKLADRNGFTVLKCRPYFISSYFSFWLPFYALWRCWVVLNHRFQGEEGAETFTMVLRKK